MSAIRLDLELLTPCFAGGAQPSTAAELRASSMRGQLRWWFRALGGFACLGNRSLADQERAVFGSAYGRRRMASPLTIRVESTSLAPTRFQVISNASQAAVFPGAVHYLLPFLEQKSRAVLMPPAFRFRLLALWRGDPKLEASVHAMVNVFGHLGSLGYRSRRGFGAWGFVNTPPSLTEAFGHFGDPAKIVIRQMPAQDAKHALQVLSQWLHKWRNYGRSPRQLNTFAPGLLFAKKDHDAGLNRHSGEVYRPALGLPIAQRFQHGNSVDWNYTQTGQSGWEPHFSSPVLLRPYRITPSQWLALALFIDSRKWPVGHKVFLNGKPRSVSLALYEAMKNDESLQPFLS